MAYIAPTVQFATNTELWIECEDCEGRGSFISSHSGSHYHGSPCEYACESCDGDGGYFEPYGELAPANVAKWL